MQKGDVGCRGRRSPFLPPCYFTFSGIELASWASTHWTNCSGDPPKSSGRGPAWHGRLGKGPRVDRPETPRPGRRGPVDLADHHRLRPTPPRPPVGCQNWGRASDLVFYPPHLCSSASSICSWSGCSAGWRCSGAATPLKTWRSWSCGMRSRSCAVRLPARSRTGPSRRKPRRAKRSVPGRCLPPSSQPRHPISGTPPLRTRYTAANPFVMSLEPAGDSALTAIQSGTQQFVAGPPRPPGGSRVPMWIWRFPGLSFATRRGLRVKALSWAGPSRWLAGSGRAAVR
jgi:hypothetical protein